MSKPRPDMVTDEQREFIAKNYMTLTITAMSEHIKKSRAAVRFQMSKMNLVVPDEILKERRKGWDFQPGQAAHNKGVKGWKHTPEALAKMEHTLFKPGHKPKSSVELTDMMVATYLTRNSNKPSDKELKKLVCHHKELITAKRTQLLINRKIKAIKNGKK